MFSVFIHARSARRLTTLAFALAAIGGAVPAAANASVTVTSFTVKPSTLAADASPNVTIDAQFNYSDGSDSIQTAKLQLAPGLLANPTGVTSTCSQTQLTGGSCPSASQVGSGTIVASTFLGNINASAKLYLMPAANGTQLAQVGLIGSADGQTITGQAPITVGGGSSMKLSLSNVPNTAGGFSIQIVEIKLTINGTVDGHAFTRNPTSCAALTSKATVTTYESTTPVNASTSFTPTGCSTLAYAPTIAASATRDASDTGVGVTVTATAGATGSGTRNMSLTLPPSLVLRSTVVSAARVTACTTKALSSCPQIGTASVTTPFHKASIGAKVYFVGRGATAVPGVYLNFTNPVPFSSFGYGSSSSAGTTEAFYGLPDAPFTKLVVTLAGGTNSLFTNGTLCTTAGNAKATFTPWSGTAAVTKTAAMGCS
jgi:hypothetical protein